MKETIASVQSGVFHEKKEALLEKIELIKLELTEIHKRYFLSHIATEIRTSLDCEVANSIVIGEKEEETFPKITETTKRSVQMYVVGGNIVELRNNFNWDNNRLNNKVSIR